MSKARFAGDAFKKLKDFFIGDMSNGELAARFGMDALGGGMAMMYTPGDIGDKLIAGAASTVGGAMGGIGASRLGGAINPALGSGLPGIAIDAVGSIGGDIGLSLLGEEAMKAKSYLSGQGYLSPYDKMSQEQQIQLRNALEQDVLRQYGLAVPGAPLSQLSDPTTGMGVN